MQEEVKAQGLWAAHLDPELGGQGFGQVKLGLMHEILGTTPIAPLAFGGAAPDSGNWENLALAGPPSRRTLPPSAARRRPEVGLQQTEPHTAGSDQTLLSTRAERDGDGWVINGRKWFSSNASIADFLIVHGRHQTRRPAPPARLDVRRRRRHPRGEHHPRRAHDEAPPGCFARYGNHSEIVYDNVRLPAGALLGAEGAGFLIAQQRLYPGRIHHCMRWLGVARRAFDMLCERSLYRYAHGSTLAGHQSVQNWIADSAAEMQAARLMTLHAAWKMDNEGVAARAPTSR